MLGTVAAVVWLARPSAPGCGANHEAAATSRLPVVAVTFAPVVSGEERYSEFGRTVCWLRDLPTDSSHAGVSTAEYGRADRCGGYLDLQARHGHVPSLVGGCSECAANQRDASASTFVRIADFSDGVAGVRYRSVGDPRPAPDPSYQMAPDSSAFWFAVLFGGTENGGR
ncbi:hypothetical protein AB0M45_06715 [Nocardia sp. NPDC051787]|uniref:hypothetical protein n=1 Tax=Nocardia sp. NPDC051787 TaxID=3155415 RepID=UPI00341ADA68